MKTFHLAAPALLALLMPIAFAQKAPTSIQLKPIETTVCAILADPSSFNNKFVKVRGYVQVSSEYSILTDDKCPADIGIWFALADNSGPPGLEAIVNGKGTPGGKDSKGRTIPPVPVRLIRDSNFKGFEHYMTASAHAESCADRPPTDFPPECTTYRVTATFTGRIDSVSKALHSVRLKRSRSCSAPLDWKGFGHMGMFDAQLVVQSVEEVVAVDEDEFRKQQSKPQ